VPDCHRLDIPAQVAQSPPPPDLTPEARASAASGTARVRVQLDADGTVTGTAVLNSSGNGALDDVAVTLARAARYSPATHQCKTVASYYDFTARFSPW
jgi:TonB family protein